MSPVAAPLRVVKRAPVASGFGRRKQPVANITLQTATAADADAIHALIVEHLADGRLLPRERGEIAIHAHASSSRCRRTASSPARNWRR